LLFLTIARASEYFLQETSVFREKSQSWFFVNDKESFDSKEIIQLNLGYQNNLLKEVQIEFAK